MMSAPRLRPTCSARSGAPVADGGAIQPVEYRVPPQDMDAEAAVLSAVMTDPNALPVVAEILEPRHMYSEAHRRSLEAAFALASANLPTDVVQVAGWLRDADRLQQVGGMAYLTQLLNAAPVCANVRPYAMRVQALWRLREVQAAALRVLAESYSAGQEASAFCEKAAQAFHALAYVPGSAGELEPIGGPVKDAFSRLMAAASEGRSLLGLPTGLDRLDRVLGGLQAGELAILAARPGRGKSAAALQWSMHVAALGHAVAFFSLEMPKAQLAMRATCVAAKVDVSHMRTGTVSPAEWQRLTPATVAVAALPLHVDDTPALTAMGLRARLRRLCAELARARRPPPKLAVVDYLQLMHSTAAANRQGRERAVAEIAQDLKEIAKEFNIAVVAPCQMNRAIEQGERAPRLSDLRESGNIEQAADVVIFIHETKDRNVVQFVVEKQRNGPNAIVQARFQREFTAFHNIAEDEYGSWQDGADR